MQANWFSKLVVDKNLYDDAPLNDADGEQISSYTIMPLSNAFGKETFYNTGNDKTVDLQLDDRGLNEATSFY